MKTKTQVTLFEKDGNYGALGVVYLPEGTLMNSFDQRTGYKQHYAEYGNEKARSYESQVEQTVSNGWRIIIQKESQIIDSRLSLN